MTFDRKVYDDTTNTITSLTRRIVVTSLILDSLLGKNSFVSFEEFDCPESACRDQFDEPSDNRFHFIANKTTDRIVEVEIVPSIDRNVERIFGYEFDWQVDADGRNSRFIDLKSNNLTIDVRLVSAGGTGPRFLKSLLATHDVTVKFDFYHEMLEDGPIWWSPPLIAKRLFVNQKRANLEEVREIAQELANIVENNGSS